MLYNAWPDTLRYLLKETGLSQADVAKNAGTNEQTISRWTNGATHPRRTQITRIAKGFKLSVPEVGYVLGRMMARYYRERVPENHDTKLREGSENGAPSRSIEERAHALLQVDLDAVLPELKPALRAHRSELHNFVKEHEYRTEASVSRLESLISTFEDLYESATRVTPKN